MSSGSLRSGRIALSFLAGIAATAWRPWIAQSIFAFVAVMWLVPDRRIENALVEQR